MNRVPINSAIRIAFIYALLSGLWILFSDNLLNALTQDTYTLTQMQNIKGWGFVIVTAFLLYIERRHSDEKIEQLANVVKSSDDAIIGLSLDGDITSWNTGAKRMYGYYEKEVLNRSASILIPLDRREEMALYLERVQEGKHLDHYETDRVRKDGGRIQVSLNVSPITNAHGRITGVSTIARDVTSQKLMAIRLTQQRSTLRSYAIQVLKSQEEERKRISRELHDQTVQDLVGLKQRLELSRREMDRDPDQAKVYMDQLESLIHKALVDVRRMSNELRPVILEDLGLQAAIEALCDDLSEQITGADIRIGVKGVERQLPTEMELTIYRVIQEALTNIHKHAKDANHVYVNLYYEDWGMLISIEDDGPGFQSPDTDELERAGHLGLAGMRERVRLFEGEMDIDTSLGNGTSIVLRLPFPDAEK
jgi:PAS domain S-box-containing protein